MSPIKPENRCQWNWDRARRDSSHLSYRIMPGRRFHFKPITPPDRGSNLSATSLCWAATNLMRKRKLKLRQNWDAASTNWSPVSNSLGVRVESLAYSRGLRITLV